MVNPLAKNNEDLRKVNTKNIILTEVICLSMAPLIQNGIKVSVIKML